MLMYQGLMTGLYQITGFTEFKLIDMETAEYIVMAVASAIAIAYGIYYLRKSWK